MRHRVGAGRIAGWAGVLSRIHPPVHEVEGVAIVEVVREAAADQEGRYRKRDQQPSEALSKGEVESSQACFTTRGARCEHSQSNTLATVVQTSTRQGRALMNVCDIDCNPTLGQLLLFTNHTQCRILQHMKRNKPTRLKCSLFRWLPRTALKISVIVSGVILSVVALGGCSNGTLVGTDSCRRSEGEYYDFRTMHCVVPDNDADEQRLYLYDHLEKERSNDDSTVSARIEFHRSISWSEAAELLRGLEVGHVNRFLLLFPDVDSGVSMPVDLNRHSLHDGHEGIVSAIQTSISTRIDDLDFDELRAIRAPLIGAVQSGNFSVLRLHISAPPSKLQQAWRAHDDSIRYILVLENRVPWEHEQL